MNRRDLTALGIADALLAGEPDVISARQRCEAALGSRARWIRRLAQQLVDQFTAHWRDTVRHDIAGAIKLSPVFEQAWNSARPPRLRNFSLTSPRMSALPGALLGCVVPELPTPRDIARWLDLDIDALLWLTGPLERPQQEEHRPNHYCYRWLPKRKGGLRLLEIPKARLRAVQRRILDGLLYYVPPHEATHGFRERRSCVSNARKHLGQEVVMRMDLTDFFGSIGGGKVYELFATLGYPAAAARTLARLTTNATPSATWSDSSMRAIGDGQYALDWFTRKRLAAPHLPQGAPTSPALANLCAFEFDVRVQALAEKFNVQYTRYADDLTFSGGAQLVRRWRALETYVAAIALEQGFKVNHHKTRIVRSAARQCVTGIVVNRHLNLPREHYDRLKAMLHNCLRHGPGSQSTAGAVQLKHQLRGHIAHLGAINPQRAARLRRMYDSVQWVEDVSAAMY